MFQALRRSRKKHIIYFIMEKNSKIYIAGHRGLVGSAIERKLRQKGYNNLILRTSSELNLEDQRATEEFFESEKPEYVFLDASKVGGILANSTYPADFIYKNLMISTNIINSSYKNGVKKLVNLGSSCIYPKNAPQPMKEDCLLTSPLESTNEGYAIAKIAAIKLCRYYNEQYGTNFISLMPTNQYGINDNFNMETAHLLPMLIRRFHLAKLLYAGDFNSIRQDLKIRKIGYGLDETFDLNDNAALEGVLNKIGAYKDKVMVWGDGSVYRELMSSDDLADAAYYLMQNKDYKDIGELVNITAGNDIKLSNLYEIVRKIVGTPQNIEYDKTKPNGTFRKLMDDTKIKSLGWKPKTELADGIKKTYEWYLSTL